MAIQLKSLDGREMSLRIKKLRDILTKNGVKRPSINDTMTLSNSYRLDLMKTGKNAGITFSMAFYGKYVRAYYIKKKGLDILNPLIDIKNLITQIKEDTLKDTIKEIVTDLKNFRADFSTSTTPKK